LVSYLRRSPGKETKVKELVLNGANTGKFEDWLLEQDMSGSTVKKYLHDLSVLALRLPDSGKIDRKALHDFKEWLIDSGRQEITANSMLAAVNKYLDFSGHPELSIKLFRIQRTSFTEGRKELNKEEYDALLNTAKEQNDTRIVLILEILFGTGIRVSELQYITVEAARKGEAVIRMKGKTRLIIIIKKLGSELLDYAAAAGITSGPVIRARSGNILDRHSIWCRMKSLSAEAGVDPAKVHPHSFRHLFARTFYRETGNIAMVADIMGHSDVNTTRIYTLTTREEYEKYFERMEKFV